MSKVKLRDLREHDCNLPGHDLVFYICHDREESGQVHVQGLEEAKRDEERRDDHELLLAVAWLCSLVPKLVDLLVE